MTFLDQYIKIVSQLKPFDEENDSIDVDLLFSVQEDHLPRLIEAIRLFSVTMNKIANNPDIDADDESPNLAKNCLSQIEDLARWADPFSDAEFEVN